MATWWFFCFYSMVMSVTVINPSRHSDIDNLGVPLANTLAQNFSQARQPPLVFFSIYPPPPLCVSLRDSHTPKFFRQEKTPPLVFL
jgi:hypothetical protein